MATKGAKSRVLIVGAGLGGLTLAQCLRKQGIPFEVFERDIDVSSRSQGWAIAMHTERSIVDDLLLSVCSDMPPLRESTNHLAPLNLDAQIALYYGGRRLGVQNTPETPCMRANRLRLRKWLATEIPIQWGKKLQAIEEGKGQVTLRFADGKTAEGDIVVGADGVQSIVREYLLQKPNTETLNYIPMGIIVGETVLSGAAMERQLSLGRSCYTTSDKNRSFSLFVGLDKVREDQNSGEFYWFVVWNDNDVDKPDHWLKRASTSAKLEHALKLTEALDPSFREVVQLTPAEGILDKQMVYRDAEITDLPVGRVTLLGDAIHPMVPFRGEGGMHALRDAINLSKVLSQLDMGDPRSMETAMASYQQEITSRGVEAVRMSRNAITNNNSGGKIISWGHEAKPLPEEHVSLESCRT
ncbi:Uu.00g146500.m01.CDS01 [Anthostomella pinea]|uniref:Uu.00g146500.m01.CDS01 n=1 Tax=Anthostomella pinea TaxID=933095 RepID=A0AAI8VRX2_9PEZI|nr:Uu.00g146500.m01.CDS01 [Anthostomella pinea]